MMTRAEIGRSLYFTVVAITARTTVDLPPPGGLQERLETCQGGARTQTETPSSSTSR